MWFECVLSNLWFWCGGFGHFFRNTTLDIVGIFQQTLASETNLTHSSKHWLKCLQEYLNYLVVSNIFYVHPCLGTITILTIFFQMG